MFFVIIGCLLLLYSCFNYKKGFMLYLIFEIIWFPNAKFFSISGLPSIPLYLMLSAGFFVLYIVKHTHNYRISLHSRVVSFPFKWPFILLALSRFITCFYSLEGFNSEFARCVGYILYSLIEIVIMWDMVETKEDFEFLFKGYACVFTFAVIYGIVEYVFRDNPIFEYKQQFVTNLNAYKIDVVRGYRMMSVFEHPIGAGINISMFSVLVILVLLVNKTTVFKKKVILVITALGFVCIFLTKMRASLLFCIIFSIAIFDFRKKRTYGIAVVSAISIIIMFAFLGERMTILQSLYDKSAQMIVGGSSLEMRIRQFEACVRIFKISPLAGLGSQFVEKIATNYLINVYALESVVFEEMTKYGILGMLATGYLFFYYIIKVPAYYKTRENLYLALALCITNLLTSIPGVRMSLFYSIYFFWIKQSDIYINSEQMSKL